MLILSLHFEESVVVIKSTLNSIILQKHYKSNFAFKTAKLKSDCFLLHMLSTFTTLKHFTD